MAQSIFKYINVFKATNTPLLTSVSNIRTVICSARQYAKTAVEDDAVDVNKPVQFLNSDAAKWKAHVSRTGRPETGPWYQSYVISISLSIFMVYFFILREENDIDLEFGKNLYDHISGLEEKQLEIVKEYNLDNNIATADIDARLKEIRAASK